MGDKRVSFVLDVDLLTLRSFLGIVDLGSFSAAAQQIGRTQSAVSLQISKLEDRMDVLLFERTSRSVELTPAGETFAVYARRIIELSDEGFAAVSATESAEPLRIGFAEYLVPRHLQRLLTRFKRSLPKEKVGIKLGMGFELYNDLSKNQLDIVIAGPEGDGGLLLFSEPLVWVGAKNIKHDFSGESLTPLSIVQMKAPCSYRKAALESLAAEGVMWSESVSVNTIQGIQSAVGAGFGVSTMPRSAVSDDLEIIDNGLPQLPTTDIYVFWNTTNPHPLTKRFISFFQEELRLIGLFL